MPEPPSIDGGLIGPVLEGVSIYSEPRQVPLSGGAGAATPGALVRVMNLDDAAVPLATATAGADGSFQLTVLASSGDELRFLALRGGQRSQPADFRYTFDVTDALTPSPRHACVNLQPGLELELGAGAGSVRFFNGCSGPIELSAPRFRTGTDFALVTSLPLVVAPGESAAVELELLRAPPPEREDVWFSEVTLDATSLRYPIGVYAGE